MCIMLTLAFVTPPLLSKIRYDCLSCLHKLNYANYGVCAGRRDAVRDRRYRAVEARAQQCSMGAGSRREYEPSFVLFRIGGMTFQV